MRRQRQSAAAARGTDSVRLSLRSAAALLAAGGLLVGGAAVRPGTARADTTFDAAAIAYGARVTYTSPSTPLGIVPEASGPTAQARLSSLPRSSALASFPYPGDALVGLPGLIGALAPGSPTLPQYPFYASAELGDQPSSVSAPGIELSAASTARAAASKAESVSASSGYVATTRIEQGDDGSVAAVAEARQSALNLAGLMTLDGIHSLARIAAAADGKLARTSSLEIDALRVPGLHLALPAGSATPGSGGGAIVGPQFALRDGQFFLVPPTGNGLQVPIATADFFAALHSAGITGSYQAATDSATGVLAPVLSLSAALPAPPPNPTGIAGASTVRLDIGQTNAAIDARVVHDPAPTTTLVPVPPTAGAGLPASLPDAPSAGAQTLPAATGGAAGTVPTVAVVPGADKPALRSGYQRLAASRPLHRSGAAGLFLALIGACLIGVGTVRVVLARGVGR